MKPSIILYSCQTGKNPTTPEYMGKNFKPLKWQKNTDPQPDVTIINSKDSLAVCLVL